MKHRQSGFTLIEIMIVVAIIAVIAAIAIPSLIASRLSSNETAAIGTLKTLHTAQSQFQQRALVDRDGDGVGEYGGFRELSGAVSPRAAAGAPANPLLRPPLMSDAFGITLRPWGHVQRNGYLFQICLPLGNSGRRYPELRSGLFHTSVNQDSAETAWVCYAWPQTYGSTGSRTFCINQVGVIVATDDPAYTGPDRQRNRPEGPRATQGAAFVLGSGKPGTDARSILGRLAVGEAGGDGNIWNRVE